MLASTHRPGALLWFFPVSPSGVVFRMTELAFSATGSAAQDRQVRGLFERTQTAYHAFDGLPRLVDELRLLSVNAQLASARAGDYGRAVRVLTLFSTEAVGNLLAVVPRMLDLKRRSYGLAGQIMRTLSEMAKIEAAGQRVVATGHRFPEDDPLPVLAAAGAKCRVALGRAVAALEQTHAALGEEAGTARTVMLQTEIIAANIAIEATAAGPYQQELEALAAALRERSDALRAMIHLAAHRLRDAAEVNVALAALGLAGRGPGR